MRWRALFSYIALCAVAMTACKDDEKEREDLTIPPFSDEEYAIYIAFTYDSIPASGTKIPCAGIWYNPNLSGGNPSVRKLSPGRDEGVEVFDLYVTENKDVYTAGCFGNAAAYWINDTEVELPEGRAATGIEVDPISGKVYTCGAQKEGSKESAKMWIGTKPTTLPNGIKANKLNIYDGKCYIAGYGVTTKTIDGDDFKVEEARYWIDGQSYNRLSQNHENDNNYGDFPAVAYDIAYNGKNWWCVGQERNSMTGYLPKVWINRSNNDLIPEGPASSLNCIKYENGVFYIGGNDGYHAKYWTASQKSDKENRVADLVEYNLSSGSTQGIVEGIDVLNRIVVCCGYERSNSNSNIPKLWINGNEYALGKQLNNYSNVHPRAIAIVRR